MLCQLEHYEHRVAYTYLHARGQVTGVGDWLVEAQAMQANGQVASGSLFSTPLVLRRQYQYANPTTVYGAVRDDVSLGGDQTGVGIS